MGVVNEGARGRKEQEEANVVKSASRIVSITKQTKLCHIFNTLMKKKKMHLNECLELAYVSGDVSYSPSECAKDWFWKSSTEFYGWDDRLQLNHLFGALCWSYSLAGLVMLWVQPSWTKRAWFPYRAFAFTLIFIQGRQALRYFENETHICF